MAARDRIHHAVKNALIKDGWTITDDPFAIEYEDAELRADLGAERTLAAERGTERIVVEIKSFLGRSWHRDLQQALGQFEIYRALLALTHPDRLLYLAIGIYAYTEFFERKSVQVVMEQTKLKLIVVDTDLEEVKKMDRIAEYRTYIKRGLLELRDLRNRSGSDGIEALCAFDDEHGQYLLRYVGWDQKRRKDKTMLHVRLHNGKIWIETDDTEDGFATELLRCGVPATDIVLAFHPPQLRDMTDFAVA